uniref:Uncharacterized protein n=1 Tax=Tanacetum cinerariifolium TaxID=118510 RepID=A0A6L2K055_TANCI|nr:hypothetical protein [Tanacetum cinerariifolium]
MNKRKGDRSKRQWDDNIKDKDWSEAKDDGYEVKDNVNNENDFENMLGDDTEDEVSMDIDIPNKEMKQKEEADKKRDFVFETKDGAAMIRDYMQTLAP